ncbi:hypothetical protein BA1DRAFT_04172 [Photorhabdus aegyptia]|uniref:Uncharacterized protein n=1 Tax=Photorhabdus aegyptia TaxID=2805098 RepID=A0A022PAZ6_9GAMM|nr:hypothetical protein BA1DRAFT_04172 [Photorhabdus aegyptia]
MIWVSAQEVIAFHDRILRHFLGVAGIADSGVDLSCAKPGSL